MIHFPKEMMRSCLFFACDFGHVVTYYQSEPPDEQHQEEGDIVDGSPQAHSLILILGEE
jgi:hypothetical protein